jgi:hypothetical protein
MPKDRQTDKIEIGKGKMGGRTGGDSVRRKEESNGGGKV